LRIQGKKPYGLIIKRNIFNTFENKKIMKSLGLSIILCFVIYVTNAQIHIEKLPQKAKDFELTDIEHRAWSLAALKGKVIVINIWGTTCRPCIKEIPDLNKVEAKYSDKDVFFLAVSDNSKEDLVKFSQKKEFSYHLAGNAQPMIMNYNATPQPKGIRYADSSGVMRSVTQNFTVTDLPQNIVINKNREIIFAKTGLIKNIAAVLTKEIDKALNE
jgi:peroxiredoxin